MNGLTLHKASASRPHDESIQLVTNTVDDRRFAQASAMLTASERALVHGVFGPDFKTDAITKYYHNTRPLHRRQMRENTSAYVTVGNDRDIHFIGADASRRDYSRLLDEGTRAGLFMHEMTHIWQNRGHAAPVCKDYHYRLTESAHFADFCNEQQAEMVSDYTRLFLQPDNGKGYWHSFLFVAELSDNKNLRRVVEEQFPHARISRLTMQLQFNVAGACLKHQEKLAQENLSTQKFNWQNAWQICASRHVKTLSGERLHIMAHMPLLSTKTHTPSLQRSAL